MKKLVASIILVSYFITPLSYAEYVAEDLGLDLYSKIDKGSDELKMQLVDKRIRESKAKSKLNDALKAMCRDEKGKASLCLSDKEFSAQDLDDISNGNTKVLQTHKKEWVVLSTDDISEITARTKEAWGKIQSETSQEQDRLEKMGSLGIYTDGSLKNSSYDLSVDLENIHAIVFSKDIPYPGKYNPLGNESFGTFLTSGQQYSLAALNPWKSDSNNTGPRVISVPATGNTTASGASGASSTTSALDACQSSDIPALDANLLSDIASTLTTGSSEQSTASAGDPSETGSGNASGTGSPSSGNPSGNASGGGGGDVQDSFPCSTFFCIKIGIEAGFGYLLGGGKSQSIEWVLDKNLKIVDKYKDSSFIAARFTNDFFELSLKNLNLSSLAHIGVIVSSLPAPILGLNPSQTPRGSGPTDEQREFEELQAGVLKEFGFDPLRENSIDNQFEAYKINSSVGGSTEELAAKRDAVTPTPAYVTLKESEIISRFPDAFSKDLLEFSAFSRTFHDYIEGLVSLSKKFDEIPQGGK